MVMVRGKKIRNRSQRHETGESNGSQPAGRNRNQRTLVTEPRRHVTETGAITQGFFCIEDIAIVITSLSKHVFCRQTQCLQAMRRQSRVRVAVFSQVLGASTCSPAHRRDRRQSFAGLVGADILTLVPNARFGPGLLTSLDHRVWEWRSRVGSSVMDAATRSGRCLSLKRGRIGQHQLFNLVGGDLKPSRLV